MLIKLYPYAHARTIKNISLIQPKYNMEECEGSSSSSYVSDEISSNIIIPSGEELKSRRKDYTAKRDVTKIASYKQFQQWRSLKDTLKLKTDKQLAEILLDQYEKTVQKNPVCSR